MNFKKTIYWKALISLNSLQLKKVSNAIHSWKFKGEKIYIASKGDSYNFMDFNSSLLLIEIFSRSVYLFSPCFENCHKSSKLKLKHKLLPQKLILHRSSCPIDLL